MPTKAEHAATKRKGQKLYDQLLEAQGGTCAICPRPPYARRYCIDHDHRTLELRGLLCFKCNYFVMQYDVTPELLEAAAEYLRNPPARKVLASLEGDAQP